MKEEKYIFDVYLFFLTTLTQNAVKIHDILQEPSL